MHLNETSDRRPVLGDSPNRQHKPKFLFVAFFDPNGINTVCENIANWQQFTEYNFVILNLWPHKLNGPLAIPASIELDDFDGVLLHPTVSYFPSNLLGLDRFMRKKFRRFRGVKILVKQDEHYHSAIYPKFLAENEFDILITCVPEKEIEKVYPRAIIGEVSVFHALTGYVSPLLRSLAAPTHAERKIDVSYRGSLQPLSLGQLGYEKRAIGQEVQKSFLGNVASLDISSRWEDRYLGNDWFEFIGNSKCILGVESGSNLFDFDGAIEKWCGKFEKEHSDLDPFGTELYQKATSEFLFKYEGNVDYAQISPRHFEAAATRSVQLMYEGNYSGIFIPGRHYLSLKRDLSNLEEHWETIQSPQKVKELTEAAFEEIILNDQFSYSKFVFSVDRLIEKKLGDKTAANVSSNPRLNQSAKQTTKSRALLLMSHDPKLDPRIDWISKGLIERGFEVVELGLHKEIGLYGHPTIERINRCHTRVRLERNNNDWSFISNPASTNKETVTFEHHMMLFMAYANMPKDLLAKRLGAHGASPTDIHRFRFHCEHLFQTNSSLLQAARLLGNFDVVIGADMDVLPATLAFSGETGAVSVYDSHEYWAGTFLSTNWEFEFWSNIQRNLAAHADICLTVSPPLAALLSDECKCSFMSVPNCEPYVVEAAINTETFKKETDDKVIFLFQGTFHPQRPVAELIKCWDLTDKRAVLWLRGPDWSYKEELVKLAKATGLLGTRIFFPDAVDETVLVDAAAQADVGIIPYDPSVHAGYRYACPNKLSQYLAAGLPILTSPLEYVVKTVTENNLGLKYELNNSESLVAQVNFLVKHADFRAECSQRARRYFEDEFNWRVVSDPFYEKINSIIKHKNPKFSKQPEPINLDWIEEERQLVSQRIFPQSVELALYESGKGAYFKIGLQQLVRALPRGLKKNIRMVVPLSLLEKIMRAITR